MKAAVCRSMALVLLIAGTIAFPGRAFADEGTILLTVHKSYGVPLSGAAVTVDGAPSGTTDASGTLSIRVSTGKHRIEISHPGFETLAKAVDVGSRHARELSARLQPLGSESQRLFGSRPFAHALSVGYVSESDRRLKIKRGQRGSGTVAGPVTLIQYEDINPATENQRFENSLDVSLQTYEITARLRSAGGVSLSLGGSHFDGFSSAPDPSRQNETSEPNSGTAGLRRFRPLLTAIVGRADVEFRTKDRMTAGDAFALPSSSYKGSASAYGGEFDLVYVPCERCPWHYEVGYRYIKTNGITADRRPSTPVQGATILVHDFGTFDYAVGRVHALAGYGNSRVNAYVGLDWRNTTSNMNWIREVNYSTPTPPPGELRSLDARFQDNAGEAIAGAMFRIGRSRFLGRVEGRIGDHSDSASVALTYAFKARQWSR